LTIEKLVSLEETLVKNRQDSTPMGIDIKPIVVQSIQKEGRRNKILIILRQLYRNHKSLTFYLKCDITMASTKNFIGASFVLI